MDATPARCSLLLVAFLVVVPTRGWAQQPYWQRPAAGAARTGQAERDPFQPYRTTNDVRWAQRGYASEDRAPMPTQVRANPYAARRNYFPGAAEGVHPNRNYIPPGHLCAPGRRAYLYSISQTRR